MNNRYIKWKYGLVALVVAAFWACSENADLAQMVNKQVQQSGTRAANWFTKEVTLDSIGVLETKVLEAMASEDLEKLEKLVVTGPMGALDFNYLRNYLSHLKSLDLKDATIHASNDYYWNPYYGSVYLQNDTICRYMFSNWSSLTEIVLPETALSVGEYAFYGCSSLFSVTLPAGLESIESYVFNSCDSLKSIAIPDKVKYIGDRAFNDCNLLQTVEFSSSSELDSIADYAFYRTGLKSIVIPDKVKYIGNEAFYDCISLSSVTLPADLESIESRVFNSCDSLKSITIPDKVKYIGYSAFDDCNLLQTVEFSSSSELDSIANDAFYRTGLKSIVIPDKVKYIGNRAFYYCYSLSSVTLPADLESIESHVFYSCDSLKSITIPDKVKYIGDWAFYECNLLQTVEFSSSSELDSIADYAFRSTGIKSIVIPDKVKYIGSHAFYDCNSLSFIYLPLGLETIGEFVFRSNDVLTELTIPETVTSIGENFAYDCNNLSAVFWNASVDVPYCYNRGGWNAKECFLYVETDQEIAIDECWTTVIKNGVAQSTITIQAGDNNEFRILKEFTAPEVVYTRSFDNVYGTTPGVSSAWQTIVLPFTPDSIYHDSKGQIAPFNSNIEGAKPFWLRELTADGFVDVTSITPDKAYIIAMPDHSDYLDEYRLRGTITFTAKNVTLAKTPDKLESSVGPDFELHPTYDFVKKALYVYSLNTDYDNWQDRSYFVRSGHDIQPFKAYVTAIGGGRSSRSLFEIDGRSKNTRSADQPNKTGIPQIGDM